MGPAAELIAPAGDPDGWNFAVPDWKDRLRSGASIMPHLPLDRVAAARAVGIFNKLRLPDVPGQPELLEAAGDWFRDAVAALHGSIDETGRRRVRELFVLVPKKNSKTTNAAGLMLGSLLVDDEPNQFYGLYGPTQAIADRGFAQAKGMIGADREGVLQSRFHVRDHLKEIEDLKTKTVLKVATFDEKIATGTIPKGYLVDEVHILGKMAYAQRVMRQLRGGLLARPGGFGVMITTQSDEPPAGEFKATLELARAIRDGRVTGPAAQMLPLLYEFPEELQKDRARPWLDPNWWPMVLPNLGRSLRLDMLVADFEAERTKGEEAIRIWCSQHLNIQIGLALQGDRWGGADYWERAAESLTLDELIERSEVAVVGIDGGGHDDLLGVYVIGRERETRRWLGWGHAFAFRGVLDLREAIASRLLDFEKDGDLTFCDSPTDDLAGVAAIVKRLLDAGLLPEDDAIGLDSAHVADLVDALVDIGVTDGQMKAIAQGWRLMPATKGAVRKLMDGTFTPAIQALLAWCVSNAKAQQRGNAVLIEKQAAGVAKIDPLVALFNAFMLMARNPVAAGSFEYTGI